MKRKTKLVATLVLASLSLCMFTPKVAEAGFYNGSNGAYFAADSSILSGGKEGWAFSANFECIGDNQSVQVISVIYYREISTGNGGGSIQRSASDSGADPYADFYCDPPSDAQEISMINSIHNGYWNGMRLTENTSDRH